MNKNGVARISQSEYKDVLLNNKCLRHSTNRVQSKNKKIWAYKIKKKLYQKALYNASIILNNGYNIKIEIYEIINISLPCFDDTKNELALGY